MNKNIINSLLWVLALCFLSSHSAFAFEFSRSYDSTLFGGLRLNAVYGGYKMPKDIELWRSVVRMTRVFEDEKHNQIGSYCTASIISDKVLLTAAHCLPKIKGKEIELRLDFFLNGESGITKTYSKGQYTIATSEKYKAVADDKNNANEDLAIVKFNEKIANDTFVPIALVSDELELLLKPGSVVLMVGAGTIGYLKFNTTLKFAPGSVASRGKASIWVTGLDQGGICFGDSGGPLIGADSKGHPILLGVLSRFYGDTDKYTGIGCTLGGGYTLPLTHRHAEWLAHAMSFESEL